MESLMSNENRQINNPIIHKYYVLTIKFGDTICCSWWKKHSQIDTDNDCHSYACMSAEVSKTVTDELTQTRRCLKQVPTCSTYWCLDDGVQGLYALPIFCISCNKHNSINITAVPAQDIGHKNQQWQHDLPMKSMHQMKNQWYGLIAVSKKNRTATINDIASPIHNGY